MHSISGKNWEELNINKRLLEKIKIENNFSELVSKLILIRNFSSEEILSISNDLAIANPFLYENDFLKAAKIIEKTISKDEKILVIGDYDVDGCVSTSLFVNFFKKMTDKIDFFIPNRFINGYGANLELIKNLFEKKPKLVIFLDCGSSSQEAIKFLKSKKISSIIIDHHEIYQPYPVSDLIINPKKKCNYEKYDYLSASTLVFFFLDFYKRKKKIKIIHHDDLFYVLLSIISDVMPMRGINRLIAIKVLKNFKIEDNYLVKSIFQIKNIKRPFDIGDLGFLISPILNSAGRLGDATKVVDLLTSKNYNLKKKIINDLIFLNEKRKLLEEKILKEIDYKKIQKINDDILIIHLKNLNEGLIGIIASRLKEYFDKPCIILTNSTNILKASARSTENFNFGSHIKAAIEKKIIIKGGGHNLAAGFSISKAKLQELKDYMNSLFKNKKIKKTKFYLSKISSDAVNSNFYKDLQKISPFGMFNEAPFFLLENIIIVKPKLLNKKYISFFIKSKNGRLIKAISFWPLNSEISKNLLNNKNKLSLIVQINENHWNNKKNLQLIVSDLILIPNKA